MTITGAAQGLGFVLGPAIGFGLSFVPRFKVGLFLKQWIVVIREAFLFCSKRKPRLFLFFVFLDWIVDCRWIYFCWNCLRVVGDFEFGKILIVCCFCLQCFKFVFEQLLLFLFRDIPYKTLKGAQRVKVMMFLLLFYCFCKFLLF
jgi:hypothetical protein